MQTFSYGTFDWLEIYELVTYFPFSTRISIDKNGNIVLNILLLLITLTLKDIRMKETTINYLKTPF